VKTSVQLVSTKKLSHELLEALTVANIQVIQEDFIRRTVAIPQNLLVSSFSTTVVFTSKMGVRAWIEIVKKFHLDINRYSIYCLSHRTKALAVEHGLRVIGIGNDATSLTDAILKDKSIDRITYICGNRRRDELPNKLRSNGLEVQEIVAYKTELTPTVMRPGYQGILFFSPSAVESYYVLNQDTDCTAFCLGHTTAHEAQRIGFSKVQIADSSTPESLVEKIIHFYKPN
jgi:uroporphyrinogen-III synthase